VPDDSIDTLNRDITSLIASARIEFSQNLHDGTIQTRLKALLDLQSILASQKLPPDQIALIKDQVKALSAASKPPTPPQPVPPPVQIPVAVSQAAPQPPSLASLLGGPNALAALLARSSSTPQNPAAPPPPNLQSMVSQPQYIPPTYPPAASPPANVPAIVPNPTSLLDQLRAAGLLPPGPTATNTQPMPQLPQIPLPGRFSGVYPPPLPTSQIPNQPTRWTGIAALPNDVQLKPASLKM